MYEDLRLKPIAIGSLPHSNVEKAMNIVKKDFDEIPFFPQLSNVSKKEDMIIQFLEGFPGVKKIDDIVINSESDEFYAELEEFFADYEEILSDISSEKLEKYGISDDCSSTFPKLLEIVKNIKPKYAKGQIVGPFTLNSSLTDTNGINLIFDETLRDIVTKLLSLKVLWQIKQIKSANSSTVPIIFMDEPTLSQLGTSAYITVSESDVISMLSEICGIIKDNGGICAMHCCGKCDWSIPIKSGVDIINLDGFSFGEHISLYSDDVYKFLQSGGKIAWGIVPTLSDDILKNLSVEDLSKKFCDCVKYLTNKGIDEKLVIDNSLITSSCGAGSLSEELSEKAMDMVKELSTLLRERY